MIVAAAVPSPGIPKRIEVISPVVPVIACIPRRKEKAEIGSLIVQTKGSMRARVASPPSPGSIPTTNPIAEPRSRNPKAGQDKTCIKPEMKASIII